MNRLTLEANVSRIPLLPRLIALLVLVPLLDLAAILVMVRYTNGWITFGTVVACGILGAVLVRHEGMRTWDRLRYEIAMGQMPAIPLMDGVLVLVAGVLLMTPGPLTDLAGIILLLPPVRAGVRLYARMRIEKMLMDGAIRVASGVTVHT